MNTEMILKLLRRLLLCLYLCLHPYAIFAHFLVPSDTLVSGIASFQQKIEPSCALHGGLCGPLVARPKTRKQNSAKPT